MFLHYFAQLRSINRTLNIYALFFFLYIGKKKLSQHATFSTWKEKHSTQSCSSSKQAHPMILTHIYTLQTTKHFRNSGYYYFSSKMSQFSNILRIFFILSHFLIQFYILSLYFHISSSFPIFWTISTYMNISNIWHFPNFHNKIPKGRSILRVYLHV